MKRKQVLFLVLALIMISLVVEPIWATTISDIKREKDKAQDQLNAIDGKISDISGIKDGVEETIKTFEQELVEILTSLSVLEDELIAKEEEIEIATIEYEKAKAEEEEQYEAMIIRMKFMYEKGDASYVEMFLEAKSITDMLNKADYIEKLYTYDRTLLLEYQDKKQQVAETKKELELQQEEIKTLKHQQEEEQAALDAKLAEKQKEADGYEAQLATAKQEAAIYKAQIKKQMAEIKKLEEEEARRIAAMNKKPSSSGGKIDPLIITNAKGSALGKEIAQYAIQFIGNPYILGGTSLTSGADCSGFTYRIYQNFGFSIPRSSTSQRNAGRSVSFSEIEPGDLVCYAGHVAMYIGGGKIVHASTSRTGIIIGNVSYKPIITIRRVV